ncbi:MAG: hypothetical protein MZV63_08290 [Marinilabiliales bacterium]|nr:hypothetical protein [Marinilabiliales bacterium]
MPHESKNDIWERFREATSKVNKRHHEFFEKQKDDQKKKSRRQDCPLREG